MSTAFVFGLSPWKKFIRDWLPHDKVYRRDRSISWLEFHLIWRPRILWALAPEVLVWGYKSPAFIEDFCAQYNIRLTRIEDGFIRSVKLGASKAPPLSLCFDSPVLYFDSTAQSRLEYLLETYDFLEDESLLLRARRGMELLVASGLSKYNASADVDIDSIYGQKERKRILVVGQVEDDMSIIKGCRHPMNNNDLVRAAAAENPTAQIIYKPHPEILHGTRRRHSNPDLVKSIAKVLEQDVPLASALRTVDHVYTMTSLAGFEALIRGIHVTCFGMPFYAGWGVTDDRQVCERRTARRTVEEIFAGAYLLYPKYHDPYRKAEITFEEAIEVLRRMKMAAAIDTPSAVVGEVIEA
ncbi:capsular polysaccharide biosynthesis protein [Ensifer adhaerens]|uniref:capsular polysaccharide export protein, LipB/KpsS family n=1 Tax=Ensifer canadensis TaxID=555315 RepID=UPI00148F6E85|nr:capsular polysaccharide biosynthesis protein [Ensifer canadensis]NOV21631.1 capsular polysaccharide biosynthesis protein [Ensifer canadensis]